MAKCKTCGKKGLFLKLINGECRECQNNHLKSKNAVMLSDLTIEKKLINNTNHLTHSSFADFHIPDSVLKLLWFEDGKLKNYVTQKKIPTESNEFIQIEWDFVAEEPSLISVIYPIEQYVSEPTQIQNPDYYPTYKSLTPSQRYLYLKYLENPLNENVYIGYVFIFYYGLERHLFCGDFENAFEMILQLRKAHQNKSFLNYSFCALAVTSVSKGRFDLFEKLLESTPKDKATININFLLLSKLYKNEKLTAKEIMLYARSFAFDNTRFIKSYPQLFEDKLNLVLEKSGYIYPHKIIKKSSVPKFLINSFANLSISAKTFISDYISDFKLKAKVYTSLETAHELVKSELKDNRNQYEKVEQKKHTPLQLEDSDYPNIKYYLDCENLPKPSKWDIEYGLYNPIKEQHLQYYVAIREIYKNREYPKALNHVIELCKKDIDLVLKYGNTPLGKDFNFESFKKLVIIYEKQGEFLKCIDICGAAFKIMSESPENSFIPYYCEYLSKKFDKLIKKTEN